VGGSSGGGGSWWRRWQWVAGGGSGGRRRPRGGGGGGRWTVGRRGHRQGRQQIRCAARPRSGTTAAKRALRSRLNASKIQSAACRTSRQVNGAGWAFRLRPQPRMRFVVPKGNFGGAPFPFSVMSDVPGGAQLEPDATGARRRDLLAASDQPAPIRDRPGRPIRMRHDPTVTPCGGNSNAGPSPAPTGLVAGRAGVWVLWRRLDCHAGGGGGRLIRSALDRTPVVRSGTRPEGPTVRAEGQEHDECEEQVRRRLRGMDEGISRAGPAGRHLPRQEGSSAASASSRKASSSVRSASGEKRLGRQAGR